MQSTLYACQILIRLEFSRQIFKNPQISNFIEILRVRIELFHANRRTGTDSKRDATKLTAAFRNFEKTPKNRNE